MKGRPVSLAEVMPPYRDEAPSATGRASDRTPPQDMVAEQCVLGAMMMSKDAIADVVEVLRGADFYRPSHEQIYDAIIDLYGRGEPADAVTVSAELGKRGELMRVGGGPYLLDLLQSVPVAANAGFYAEIVREKAVLRRLVDASIRIGQMSYAAEGDVTDIVDRAQAEVYGVTDRRTSEDYKSLSELMQPTLDQMEAIESRGAGLSGVPTGFADLDELTNGLHPGQMIIVAARPGVGKALAVDTPLPTPTGWTTMGEIGIGDCVLGADGRPTRVVAATPVMTGRPCFRVTFSDGTSVVADSEHQWRVTSRASRRAAAKRTPPRYYFEAGRIDHVQALASQVSDEDTSFVTMADLAIEVGSEFRNVLHSVGREIGPAVELRAISGVGGGAAGRRVVYPRRAMIRALAGRISRPKASWLATEHSDVLTTAELARQVRLSDGRANWAVELARPLQLPDADLMLDPYALGAWLGDGNTAGARITVADPQIAQNIAEAGLVVERRSGINYSIRLSSGGPDRSDLPGLWRVLPACPCGHSHLWSYLRGQGPTARAIRASDVSRLRRLLRRRAALPSVHSAPRLGSGSTPNARRAQQQAHPDFYLRSSERQRRALLAGLLDTDGTVSHEGRVQYTSTNRQLAHDVYELVVSLGHRATISRKRVAGRSEESSTAYTISFSASEDVFRLDRKLHRHRLERAGVPVRSSARYIVSIEPVPTVPVRCIQVDNDAQMFLASRAMVPTHNSTLALDLARSAAIKNDLTSVIFSLEMSQIEITMRLLSAEAGIPLSHIRGGRMSEQDWSRVSTKMGQVSEAPMFIDDSPNLTMMEIRAKARRLKQRHDLKLVIIDYIQLMTSGKKVESRQVEVSEFSRQLKLLAKELDLPVVALSQLNRGPETRNDKRPMLSDLRESGSLEQDADLVILLSRPDLYDRESDRAGEADFDVAKHRNGPTKTITVAFQGHYSRFTDMQR